MSKMAWWSGNRFARHVASLLWQFHGLEFQIVVKEATEKMPKMQWWSGNQFVRWVTSALWWTCIKKMFFGFKRWSTKPEGKAVGIRGLQHILQARCGKEVFLDIKTP